MATGNRIVYIDALKLFAIFSVLWGHSIQYLITDEYYLQPVYRFIYAFHMPLFMALSDMLCQTVMLQDYGIF